MLAVYQMLGAPVFGLIMLLPFGCVTPSLADAALLMLPGVAVIVAAGP